VVLRSLLEVSDLDTAVQVYRAAAEIADVRLYRAIKVSEKKAGSAHIFWSNPAVPFSRFAGFDKRKDIKSGFRK